MDRPNVVLMICHDLGQHLGCYGVETVNSPNLDEFAAGSVRFENNFCTAPQCSPSRSSMMTGRYPHSNGIMGLSHNPFCWEYNEGETHISARFTEAGYRTVLIGNQHVTRFPEKLGFEEVDLGGPAEEVGRKAAALLAGHDGSRPLYAQFGFVEPHRPWVRPGCEPDESKGVTVPGYLPDIPEARREFAELQGAVRALDGGVAAVLEAVREHLPAEETIVVFTVDHGIAMPRAKCTLYDPGISTAFMIRVPGCAPAVREEIVSNVDVVPTLLELSGLPAAGNVHGVSLAPLLRGEVMTPHDEIFAEMTFHTSYHPLRAVRTERWKLIVNFEHHKPVDVPTDIMTGPLYGAIAKDLTGHKPHVELYDLDADPLEQKNLAELPEHADVVRDLSARLLRWMRETGDPLLGGPVSSPFYDESMARLFKSAGGGC